ncbi:class I SAM-dependent methyltransferase [Paenibacillus guangzhouensis]|uniref:class I SAM-dependent methyltransferase n=1 Tax=Paenibacillus guangzhouensis TaxID=1473112 RepID=UPI0012674F27|nr:class I SAM-dependent methyltransferase [Paenibacillus guangzhouensis]
MSEHYYSNKPTVAHQRNTIEETLRGKKLRFVTDAGVFSKAGVDYGSKVLIDMMEMPEDAKVLDVGCGYGPIGFSAALMAPKGHVTMVDVNERAVELAKENARANGIQNVTIEQSDLFEKVAGKTFDVILTNPPIRAGKETVHRIFTEAYDHLNADGTLWIVIQKKQGAPSARAKLEELFGEDAVEEVGKDKGYRIFKSTKRT